MAELSNLCSYPAKKSPVGGDHETILGESEVRES